MCNISGKPVVSNSKHQGFKFRIQGSPFITLCLGSIKGMDHVSELCYKGTVLQRNYWKNNHLGAMTISCYIQNRVTSSVIKGLPCTVMILSFRTDMPGQTVQTQIRLLLEEQSDQGLYCLPFLLHRLDSLLYSRAT